MQPAIEICDGKDFLKHYGEFAESLGFQAKYQVFVDSGNWNQYPAKFITLNIDKNGSIAKA
ncbi:hypothetical protein [Peribacillus simplex]|uniref:hypothetical protein n=1 Tax=Peribacillus simplex TaxID=1478 RepID=UPI000BA725A4|nr:hypothetical protein [Peribacillus simplex]PAK34482.1 hypothetical protein CHI08_25510 [Peribacillus simplex]